MPDSRFFIFLALVAFIVAAVVSLVDDTPDPDVIAVCLYGGLASFAAGHL